MSNNFFQVFISVLIFSIYVEARIISTSDSITFYPDSIYIQLNNKFIIESSLKISLNDSIIKPKNIFPIEGKISLNEMPNSSLLVIQYDYLHDPLPLVIGPKWKNLPILDSLVSYEKTEKYFKEEYVPKDDYTLYSSGSFFRSLALSPYGGSDFQGGVQMEINGTLLNNINISGVLTDQNFPLQDEGSTRDLEDFDNIFLKIYHPNFLVDAGDIEYNYSDKFNNISRKLEGLKNKFKFNKWSGTSVYANSKGQFHYIEIKGRDGDQGPYQLIGRDGSRDIAILSGTEKVWANGKRLKRGQNYDYTIDYSLSVIYFTPKIMIDFDTDVFVEYQYSDFEYQKGLRGLTLKNNIGNYGYLSFGFFNEFDQYNENDLESQNFNPFSTNDSSLVTINMARIDSSGDYVLQDFLYVYDPLITEDNLLRYNVQFTLDPMGNYQRKISEEGKMFYQYISDEEKGLYSELYSPYKTITSPRSLQFGKAQLSVKINEYLSIQGQFSGSRKNSNIISGNNLSNGLSYVLNIELDTLEFDLFKLKFSYKSQERGDEYSPLGREQAVMQTRLWNLDNILVSNSKEDSFQSQFTIKKFGISNFEYAGLSYKNISLTRYRFNQIFLHKNFSNSFLDFTYVDNFRENFYRALVKIERNGSRISPNATFSYEENNLTHRYQKNGIGLKLNSNNTNIETGFDLRIDEDYMNENNWSIISNDFVAYTDINSRSEKGWNKSIIYKKRIKNSDKNQNYNYSLLDLSLSWKNRISPFSFDLDFRQEETLSQNRTVVYEYIGPGLGNYRYDSELNTYISDLNGDHISYSINIGERRPGTVFLGSQNFVIDFSKSEFFPSLIIRSRTNQEYRGKDFNALNIWNSNISDTNITKSFLFSRNEIMLSKNRSTMIWFQYKKNLEGYDPRGNNIKIDREAGMEQVFKLFKNSSVKNKIDIHNYYIDSKVYSSRNRGVHGLWNDIMWQKKLNNNFDFVLGLVFGIDKGEIYEKPFSAKALGIKNNFTYYINKNGRIQTEIIFVKVGEVNNYESLPPEALKGYAFGQSVRTNSRIQYVFNQTLSFNLNFNTINDSRYKNLMTLQGEFRAYF